MEVSACFEVMSQRFANDLRDRHPFVFGSPSEALLEFRVEANRLDR
jgi:hypothetical protein